MPVMPVFVFQRQRDIEVETGLILAGNLIVDIPRDREPSQQEQLMVTHIVKLLTEEAGAGKLSDDAVVYGWPDGRRPADADATVDNDDLMSSWANTRIRIGLRVDPHNDGMMRVDSDMLRQLDLPDDHPSVQLPIAFPPKQEEPEDTAAEAVPLDALLRRASRIAKKRFERDGELVSFWLAETSGGQQQEIVTPMIFPPEMSAGEAKLALAERMRAHFRAHSIVRYAHGAEAWSVDDPTWHGPASEHPQRKEIVILTADDGRETLAAMHEIIRPSGGKPYLGKIGEIERTRQPRGRLMDLLNDDIRPSSELPDDEGTVFVTDVPDSPFQILGRRGPTGELFAGTVFTTNASTRTINDHPALQKRGAGKVEIVTGPEAERLITGMQRRIVKH